MITVLVSTQTYHEDSVELCDDDYEGEPLDERSFALPWSLVTLNDPESVTLHMGTLGAERTDEIAEQSIGYISD